MTKPETPKTARERWTRFGLLNPLPTIRVDGRRVGLCFTWPGVDEYGHAGIGEMVAKATSGEPGDRAALAKLIEISTGGQVTSDDLLSGRRRIYFEEAIVGVARAWHSALYGAPPRLPQRWWERILRRPLRARWDAVEVAGT
ncbi:MAG: hypothetical protein Q8R97_07005 [Brevundimonas sp.]|nr:hypothetical protein [Brevundimonas sp.]